MNENLGGTTATGEAPPTIDPIKRAHIENAHTYHAPKPGQPQLYEAIRAKAKDFALLVAELTPATREQSLALTKIEEAVFWANAAIARSG